VRFLGRERKIALGPQRIARRARAPLLIGVLARGPAAGRLRLEVRELPLNSDETMMTQRVASALEAAIVALPEHWLWMAG
jgi:lauroyl/myristoyl acyltransferase